MSSSTNERCFINKRSLGGEMLEPGVIGLLQAVRRQLLQDCYHYIKTGKLKIDGHIPPSKQAEMKKNLLDEMKEFRVTWAEVESYRNKNKRKGKE